MENRDLSRRAPFKMLGRTLLAMACWMVWASIGWSQELLPEEPTFRCIYKVNDKCPDTVLVVKHPNNVSIRPLSKTQCPVKLGFGNSFYGRGVVLIDEGGALSLMMGAMHKDLMVRLNKQEPQQFTNGYGAYRVALRSQERLWDRLLVYNIRFKPESAPGSSIDLRYSPVLGIISIQNLDRQNAVVGKVEMVKVNGQPLEQFVKSANGL